MTNNVTATNALARLIEGNDRFAQDHASRPRATPSRRVEISEAQSPFAVVLCCSDSRVAPEILFDQGLGDLFVIRVAGNILSRDAVLGSIEYGVGPLGCNLVVVMGHESCGAVSATIEDVSTMAAIDEIVRAIRPAVRQARNLDGDLLENAVKVNARMVVDELRGTGPIVSAAVVSRGVQIVSAYYNLSSGRVDFFNSEA